mmetsp:Transcript_3673/g.4910  ORF Transcript_3673/g.4910 Transcript_3673/m.4910 type:complete len:96 (+) Transcript_3673:342-629(+)
MMKLVDQVFTGIFQEAFDDAGEDEIDTYVFLDMIEDKIGEDELAEPLRQLFDPKNTPTLTSQQIRDELKKLLRTRLDSYQEDEDIVIAEMTETLQ